MNKRVNMPSVVKGIGGMRIPALNNKTANKMREELMDYATSEKIPLEDCAIAVRYIGHKRIYYIKDGELCRTIQTFLDG